MNNKVSLYIWVLRFSVYDLWFVVNRKMQRSSCKIKKHFHTTGVFFNKKNVNKAKDETDLNLEP